MDSGQIADTCVPDVEAVAAVYADSKNVGAGVRKLLSFGVFEESNDGSAKLLKTGIPDGAGTRSGSRDPSFNAARVTAHVTGSWYDDSTTGLYPAAGSTQPVYPNPQGYSWLKAPRCGGKPFEARA